MIYAIQKCVKLVSHSLYLHFYNNNTLTLIRESKTNFQFEETLISMQLPSPISALQSIFMRTGQILNSVLLKQGFQSSYIGMEKGTSRQRSGKGAIRKRFPLQKPRWEKTKLTTRHLHHETHRKPNEQLFSQ